MPDNWPDMQIISSYIFQTTLIIVFLVTGDWNTAAQSFRMPEIPGQVQYSGAQDGLQLQGPIQPGIAPGIPDNGQSGFVPKSDGNGLGLVPVRPRGGAQSGAELQQFRPEYLPSRSESEQRILDQIRSGTFDGSVPGGLNVDRGPRTIRQRYPDGKVQLVRRVVQDEDGNYYNDGPWQLFNRRGEMMARGQFARGVMDGTWERWHASTAGGMFSTKPFTEFDGPFVSTATFVKGKLDGIWVINDRHQRKVVEVPYKEGRRNGTATWYYPSSERMRTINFRGGLLDGGLLEWDEKSRVVRNDEYVKGQRVVRTTTFYRPKQKSSESFFLEGKLNLEGEDSWWDAEPAEYVLDGIRMQHGPSFAWHVNGQRKMAGQYKDDVRVGPFAWWHENGTRALAGNYKEGVKIGTWTWWHNNGMKSIEGSYDNDQAVGEWMWWDEGGQVGSQEDFGDSGYSSGELVEPSADSDPQSTEDQSDLKKNPPQEGIEEMEEIRPFDSYDDDFGDDPFESSDSSEQNEDSGGNSESGGDSEESESELEGAGG